jgi:hypothetical protein
MNMLSEELRKQDENDVGAVMGVAIAIALVIISLIGAGFVLLVMWLGRLFA